MKNPATQLRLASLLSLILLAWASAHAQLTPSQDSYTSSTDPTTNYGSNVLLYVDGAKETTYIQFNLASIPSGASVSQATLKLYVNAVTTAGSFNVDYVNGSWSEGTITYNLAPALGTTLASNVAITTADKNQYILINITPALQAWLNGSQANDGIALVANGTFDASFDSKESKTTSHPPELDVVFAGAGTITGITTASGSGLVGGGTSGTLNLSLTNTCAANQVLQWSGTTWVCAAVGTGTITGVTAGTDLTGGGSSGNVTLSLNTTATNALYAQLNAANTFTGNQTVNGTVAGVATGVGAQALYGASEATTGVGEGVYGVSSSSAGGGVVGLSPNFGVLGVSYGTSKQGVGSGKAGVWGDTGGPSGSGYYGVLGTADANSAGAFYNNGDYPTLVAKNNAADATNVIAIEGQSSNIGVYGVYMGGSGINFDDAGVWGDAGGTNNNENAGVIGTANENIAGIFFNNSSESETVLMNNEAASSGTATVLETFGSSFGGECTINVSGTITCNGKVIDAVNVDGGARKVALYSMQSPENWFEDFGSGTLSNGAATIALDPTFAQTVNTGTEYHVFLTPNGDSKGLYVSQKTATSFEVREQGGGTSSIAFDYRIVGKRVGSEDVRLEDLTKEFKQREAQHKKMQLRMRPSAALQADRARPAQQLRATATNMAQPK
jgi:TGF-beta propeptide